MFQLYSIIFQLHCEPRYIFQPYSIFFNYIMNQHIFLNYILNQNILPIYLLDIFFNYILNQDIFLNYILNQNILPGYLFNIYFWTIFSIKICISIIFQRKRKYILNQDIFFTFSNISLIFWTKIYFSIENGYHMYVRDMFECVVDM